MQIKLAGGVVRAVTTSNEDGRYVLANLPAGRYIVTFAKTGYVSLSYGQRASSEESIPVELEDAQTVERIDISLFRAAAIEGRVADEDGEPLVDAIVTAMRIRFMNGETHLAAAGQPATTNDKGQYRIYGLDAGSYYISAALRNQPSFTTRDAIRAVPVKDTTGYAPTFHPSAFTVADAQRVVVRPGNDAVGIDVVFRAMRLAKIGGTLTSSTGRLLDGAHVALTQSRAKVDVPGSLIGVSPVDRDGKFSIADVPPGEYILQARSIPLSVINEIAQTGRNSALSRVDGEFAALAVSVQGVDISDLTVTTLPTGRVKGQVVLDGQLLRSSAGHPVSISAVPVGPTSISAGPTVLSVLNNGTFDMGGLLGEFVLRVTNLQGSVGLVSVKVGGIETVDTGLSIKSAETLSGVDVVLSSHSSQVTGMVMGLDNRAIANATVIVFSTDSKRWSWPATRYIVSVRSAGDGSFEIGSLPDGDYFATAVNFVEKDQWRDPDYLASKMKGASSLRVSKSLSATLVLTIRG